MTARKQAAKSARIQRILVPTDFSKAARIALDGMVQWSAKLGGKIHLVYVEPTPLPADMTQLPVMLEHEQHVQKAEKWLRELQTKAVPAGRRARATVRKGSVYYEILQEAKETKADLIAMGTHGYSGLSHALLGSVTERVVRHAACPVLTIRETRAKRTLPQRILVPVDFSKPTHHALTTAAQWARAFGVKITLLHVMEPPNYPVFGYAHVPIQERRWRAAAKARLEQLRATLDARVFGDIRIRTGSPYQEIVEEAKSCKAGLIVIGTHGHTGLAHILLGSTAERVVRHAHCPVLTVR